MSTFKYNYLAAERRRLLGLGQPHAETKGILGEPRKQLGESYCPAAEASGGISCQARGGHRAVSKRGRAARARE